MKIDLATVIEIILSLIIAVAIVAAVALTVWR